MPVPGEVYQLAMEFVFGTTDRQFNVFDFEIISGSCTDAELMTVLSTLMTTAYGRLVADVSNQVNFQNGRINQMIWSVNKWIVQRYVGTILPTINFTNAGDALPPSTSMLVSFPTFKPRVVGKKYLPTMGEDRQADGTVLGATLASMVQFGTDLIQTLLPGSATVFYIMRNKDGTTTYPYATAAEGLVSTQRKRKPGVGI